MMTSVSSARVSMNTRPRIMDARMAPAAPGLRAMPSQADEGAAKSRQGHAEGRRDGGPIRAARGRCCFLREHRRAGEQYHTHDHKHKQ